MEEEQLIDTDVEPGTPPNPPPESPPPAEYPPPPNYPPPPGMYLTKERKLSAKERKALGILKSISVITYTICIISFITFIVGIVVFNMGLVTSSATFRDIDVLRGLVMMIFSVLLLLSLNFFVLEGMKKLKL